VIPLYLLLALLLLLLAGGGLGLILYRMANRGGRGGAAPWVAGGLGCLAGVSAVACLLIVLGGVFLTGVGLVHRDRALAGATLGPLEPRLTPLTATSTPLPPGPGPFGDQALAAGMLPPERRALVDLTTAPRYTLNVNVNWPQATLTGSEDVVYTNNSGTDLGQLILRLYPNAPYYEEGALRVGNVSTGGRPARTELQLDDTVLAGDLPEPLAHAGRVSLSLSFTVTVPHRQDRFGVYQDVMAIGQWYPMLSVYDDEGWHTDPYIAIGDPFYSETSFFTFTLAVPDGMVIAASGVETGRKQLAGDRWAVTYHSPASREIAVVISPDLQRVQAMVDGTTVSSYYLPGDEDAGQKALEVAARSVQVYNDDFGGYPYSDLDVVESYFLIEGSPGGMEYPGLVLVSSVLYGSGGMGQSATTETVWAHEVAHQWWYGVVGDDEVDDPWLDEALATYSSVLYFEATGGRKVADQQLLVQCTLPYRAVLAAGEDRPVGSPLTAFENDELGYAGIVYGKGCVFFEKLRELLGHDRFMGLLRGYYAAHKYGIVRPEDMHQAILAAAAPDKQAQAERLYQSWILGK
jgi:hypothetical protein